MRSHHSRPHHGRRVRAAAGLVARLNQGPGAHIRTHAYQYSLKINAELARIGRIREVQTRFVALLGSAILAFFVGVSNLLSNFVYEATLASS